MLFYNSILMCMYFCHARDTSEYIYAYLFYKCNVYVKMVSFTYYSLDKFTPKLKEI